MTAKKHPGLNRITVVDKFRVKAYNDLMDLHYIFQAHGDQDGRKGQFTCHIYDSPLLDHSGYVQADTVGSDPAHMGIRCSASATTLDELVHDLDWAHLPSELALLRALLSTRVSTNESKPLGDMVIRRASDEEHARSMEFKAQRAARHVEEQKSRVSALAQQAIDVAGEELLAAARFGLRKDMSLSFDTKLD